MARVVLPTDPPSLAHAHDLLVAACHGVILTVIVIVTMTVIVIPNHERDAHKTVPTTTPAPAALTLQRVETTHEAAVSVAASAGSSTPLLLQALPSQESVVITRATRSAPTVLGVGFHTARLALHLRVLLLRTNSWTSLQLL